MRTTSLLAAFSITVLLLFTSTASIEADLVAHWTGDNTGVDATGNGHDGTINGSTFAAGVFGDSFSFSGANAAVRISADADLEPSVFSISMWANPTEENHIRILADSTHGAGQSGWALQINSANNLSFAYGNGSTFPEITTSAMADDGLFHHYVGTLDGTTMNLFVDGQLQASAAYSGMTSASGRDIQIGNTSAISNRAYQGLIDDVRVYDHALSQTEVSALFNSASVPEPSSAAVCAILSFSLILRRKRS